MSFRINVSVLRAWKEQMNIYYKTLLVYKVNTNNVHMRKHSVFSIIDRPGVQKGDIIDHSNTPVQCFELNYWRKRWVKTSHITCNQFYHQNI